MVVATFDPPKVKYSPGAVHPGDADRWEEDAQERLRDWSVPSNSQADQRRIIALIHELRRAWSLRIDEYEQKRTAQDSAGDLEDKIAELQAQIDDYELHLGNIPEFTAEEVAVLVILLKAVLAGLLAPLLDGESVEDMDPGDDQASDLLISILHKLT